MNMYFPIGLIVVSNIFYHVCAKSSPAKMDPFAMLVVAYILCAIISLVMYFVTNPGSNLINEISYSNWTVFVMGLAIVGLEAGNIFMYRVGWNINTGYLLHCSNYSDAFSRSDSGIFCMPCNCRILPRSIVQRLCDNCDKD